MRVLFCNPALLLLLLSLWGCATMDNYTPLPDTARMSAYVDKKVSLVGKISNTPWQHMIASVKEYPYSEYFDVGDFQIVVYARQPMKCGGNVRVFGRVLEVSGRGKRPEPGDEVYTEYHLLVDRWQCLP
jgi:hypothetical protein